MHQSSTTVIAATYEQLFRLALLTTGNLRVATQVLSAAAKQAHNEAAPEAVLLRSMQPKRRGYGRWQPHASQRARSGLDVAQVRALLRLLAQREPADRLALGLGYLRGVSSDEISAITGRSLETLAEVSTRFRADAALALGEVSAATDRTTLLHLDAWLDGRLGEEAANSCRSLVFADAETRALRDGLLATRRLLPQALSGMFAVTAPPTLLPLLQQASVAPLRQPRRYWTQHRAAVAALVGGVLAIAGIIVFAPAVMPAATTSAMPTASTIVDTAIRRFEQPPQTSGVLHERYRVEIVGQAPAVLERWYSFDAPNPLAVEVRDPTNQAIRFAVRSDGIGKISYQVAPRYASQTSDNARRIDYQLTPEAAKAALPSLRSVMMPISLWGNQRSQPEISSLYLAQANASQPVVLGRTTVAGREGILLRYSTNQLPTEDSPGRPRQVLLSFDRELYALLDVTVVEDSSGESVAYHPWRTEQIEVLPNAPTERFHFAVAAPQQVVGPRSITMPTIPDRYFTTLETATRESQTPLLLPANLPDSMRGIVINRPVNEAPRQFTTFYESEFRSLLLAQGALVPTATITWRNGEEAIGAYRYRIAESFGSFRNSALAEVYPASDPEQRTSVLLIDAYSTPAAREQQIRDVVASLTPVTEANIATFEQRMVPTASGS